jgi:hypothetical protein
MSLPPATKATLTISRTSADKEMIRFRVIDDASGTVALQLELTPEQFALGLTGQANRPVEARWQTNYIGRVPETKTEVVPYTWRGSQSNALDRALAPFEVDGWIGSRSDLGNHHRRAGATNSYRVGFVRYAERYEGERADLEVLRAFARDCLGNYAEGHTPEIAAVLRAVESFFIGGRGGV